MLYFLIALVIYPIALSNFAYFFPRSKFSFLYFLGPIGFLSLSLFIYIKDIPMDFAIWNFSSYFEVGIKLDMLSGLIATSVSAIGAVVIKFSIRYLEDDPFKKIFFNNLAYTMSFIILMLLSPNLAMLFVSWVGASYFLHQLLIHFPERKGAQKAANQKFWISRFGDLLILCSCVVLIMLFGTLNFETIFSVVKDQVFIEENNFLINLASLLLILGAMTKSAQFPFHFWLPNTMETPTPVSAIMHAGIINAGGYLLIRMSPFIINSHLSMSLLTIVGGFTAFFASVVMLTQTSVKKSLAYSTISQMGFMMLQCGLGAFSIAVVHIIGHAFYKAYAFLNSGAAADFGRLHRYYPKVEVSTHIWSPFIMAVFSGSCIFGALYFMEFNIFDQPGLAVLYAILSLAVAQIFIATKNKLNAFLTATLIVVLYITLSSGMSRLLENIISNEESSVDLFRLVSLFVSIFLSIVFYLFQNNLEVISKTEIGKKIYVRALRGGI